MARQRSPAWSQNRLLIGEQRKRPIDAQNGAFDPGCVKTAEAPKPREWLSEIAQNRPRSEIAIALIVIRGELSSINFPYNPIFTRQDP